MTSPRQSPKPAVGESPTGSNLKRPSPVVFPASRNFTTTNFRPARQPAHAAVVQRAIPAAASAQGANAPLDALGGLRTYHENRGKLSDEEELLRQMEKTLQDQREKVAGLAVQLNVQGRKLGQAEAQPATMETAKISSERLITQGRSKLVRSEGSKADTDLYFKALTNFGALPMWDANGKVPFREWYDCRYGILKGDRHATHHDGTEGGLEFLLAGLRVVLVAGGR